MFKRIVMIAAILGSSILAGCASVPMASPEADANAKSFRVPAGKSNIYIYRNESFGAAIKFLSRIMVN